MINLSSNIRFESSERSASSNWVRDELLKTGFALTSFEGYTIKDEKVSLLLDRGLFVGTPTQYTPQNLFSKLRYEFGASYDIKLSFTGRLGIPWYFLCYQYTPRKVFLLEFGATGCSLVRSFTDFPEFGKWMRSYRDMKMLSPYEESGLPEIDRILRRVGTPWPGNLDALLSRNGKLIALAELQNTTRTTVRDHCNNKWFLPRYGRKGDANRWKALDVIRLHANLPLIIIVWSRKESTVKFKIVEDIVYPWQSTQRAVGLHYSTKKLTDLSGLVKEIHLLLQAVQ